MATERSLAKDFHDLLKNIKSFSDGQAAVTDWIDEDLSTFQVTISPKDGPFSEGEFVFEIFFEILSDGGEKVPRAYCKTDIYHPNIDTMGDRSGELCMNLFDNDVWTSDCSLQDVVQGLLFLIHNPNLEDQLSSVVACDITMEEFEEDVRKSIAGSRIGNYQFPVNARYARLHPSVEEQGEGVKKEDDGGHRMIGKDREKDEQEDEKDGEDKTGTDGCKEDMERRTHLIPKYLGIKEYSDEISDEEDYEEEDNN